MHSPLPHRRVGVQPGTRGTYTNLGIGTALVAHVLATAVELNEKAARRAAVVTALGAAESGPRMSAVARDEFDCRGPFDVVLNRKRLQRRRNDPLGDGE